MKIILKEGDEVSHVELYKVRSGNKEAYYQRTGKCEPDKCGAICCRLFCLTKKGVTEYALGFGKKTRLGNVLIRKTCRHLKRNRCARWKKLPGACQQFPHLEDDMFQELQGKCSFKFVKVFERKAEVAK